MSWGTDVIERLQRQLGMTEGESTTVTVDDWHVQVDVDAVGAVGMAVNRLHVQAPVPADLAEIGRVLAARATYLLESLRLLEVTDDEALLRSAPPTVGEEANTYYEIWLRARDAETGIDMQRYRYEKEQRERTAIPIMLTWETAGRLMDDVRTSVEGA